MRGVGRMFGGDFGLPPVPANPVNPREIFHLTRHLTFMKNNINTHTVDSARTLYSAQKWRTRPRASTAKGCAVAASAALRSPRTRRHTVRVSGHERRCHSSASTAAQPSHTTSAVSRSTEQPRISSGGSEAQRRCVLCAVLAAKRMTSPSSSISASGLRKATTRRENARPKEAACSSARKTLRRT